MAIKRGWWFLVAFVVLLAIAVGLCVYMFGYVQCPWCYPYRAPPFSEIAGKRLRYYPPPIWDKMTEEEKRHFTGNPGVYVTEYCPQCKGTGAMRRIDVLLKGPAAEEQGSPGSAPSQAGGRR